VKKVQIVGYINTNKAQIFQHLESVQREDEKKKSPIAT
jgi:hypothetical protein